MERLTEDSVTGETYIKQCASGRPVKSTDREVKRAVRIREEAEEMKKNG